MTARPPRRDPKAEALRAQGALHPHPQTVRDLLFGSHEFFDARDLVQVKYEMLRRVDVDGHGVSQTTDAFGCSRPTFYHAYAAFKADGLPGLVPRKRGPRGAHKLDAEVMAFVSALRTDDATLSTAALLGQIRRRFGLAVHRRTLERAFRREEKNDAERPGGRDGGAADHGARHQLRNPAAGRARAQWPRRWSQSGLHRFAPPRHDGVDPRLGDVPSPRGPRIVRHPSRRDSVHRASRDGARVGPDRPCPSGGRWR